MAEFGRASFLHLYLPADGRTVAKWQDYFPARLVDGHVFMPFEAGALAVDETGGQQTVTIRLPDFEANRRITEEAIELETMADLRIYQFAQTTDLTDLPGTETQVGAFVGAIINATRDLSTIEWTVGNPVSVTQANAASVIFTSRLVGIPCRF